MRLRSTKSSTLLEVVISLILISILALIFAAIELVGVSHTLTVDRRAKVQNDVAYVLEHSAKQISKAIGNAKINKTTSDGDEIIKTNTIAGSDGAAIEFYVDADSNGKRDDDASTPWRAYRFRSASAVETERYQVWYCPSCPNAACLTCNTAWGSAQYILSKKITSVTYTYSGANNYVDISIQGCWDKGNETIYGNCGSSDKNPKASMKARIKMPSVSTN